MQRTQKRKYDTFLLWGFALQTRFSEPISVPLYPTMVGSKILQLRQFHSAHSDGGLSRNTCEKKVSQMNGNTFHQKLTLQTQSEGLFLPHFNILQNVSNADTPQDNGWHR